MQTDRTMKVLLALIALGLFLNALVPLTRPAAVHAQGAGVAIGIRQISNELNRISGNLNAISRNLDAISRDSRQISNGFCSNDNLC